MLKTLAISVLLVAGFAILFVGLFYFRFTAVIETERRAILAEAKKPGPLVTAKDLSDLPEPARRYFEWAGIVGKPIPSIVRIRQNGRIRSSAQSGWMAFTAEETYATGKPGFVWRVGFPNLTLPLVLGRDHYRDGKASILMKMLALLPVADESGPELGEAGLLRFLNEMMWFPAAFMAENVVIGEAGDDAFEVSISDSGLTVSAIMFVDADGRMTNFRAERFNTGSRTIQTWETPMTAYGTFEGINMPTAGSARWVGPDGSFTYIELDLTAVEYE